MDTSQSLTRYFIVKCPSLTTLKTSIHTSIWAFTDRISANQPKDIISKSFSCGEKIILIFSINKRSGWHGYAEVATEPGSISDGDFQNECLTAQDPSANSSPSQVTTKETDNVENKTWHRFKIKWLKHFQDINSEVCLPSSRTESLTLLNGQPINKARNFDELGNNEGYLLCQLINDHRVEFLRIKEDEEKKKQDLQPDPFFIPSSNSLSHEAVFQELITKVQEMGTVLIACAFGSQRYNLHTESSDMDMFVVYAAKSRHVLGLNPPSTTVKNKEHELYDYTIHEVHRFCELLVGGDPRCVETLFLHPSSIYHEDLLWQDLIKHKEVFLTRKCVEKYLKDATGSKGLRLMEKLTKNESKNGFCGMSAKIGKLYYIILRLLQNARDVTKGHLVVFRLKESADHTLLMKARNCSAKQEELKENVQILLDEIQGSLDSGILTNHNQEKCHLCAETWLLELRYQNLHKYMESKNLTDCK